MKVKSSNQLYDEALMAIRAIAVDSHISEGASVDLLRQLQEELENIISTIEEYRQE